VGHAFEKATQLKNLKIAVLVSKFDPTRKNPWLTDELCDAFVANGHSVDVFFLDWYREFAHGTVTTRDNTRIHIIAPFGNKSGLISKVLHWTLSSFGVYRYYLAHFKSGYHDMLISFSPSIVFGFPLLALRSAFRYRVLVQWDFFPYHQAQIGLIPFKWMTRLGAIWESKLLSTFTFIGCMSPKNVEYLRKMYRLPPQVHVGVVPLWAKIRDKPNAQKISLRQEFGLPLHTPIAVFGGQLAPGRGIEDVYLAAKYAAETDAQIHFLFIGKGPKLQWLKEMSLHSNAKFTVLPHVSRDRYLELISCCDAGIVATVRDVDVPTFPSKILDYCCVGLPIISSVEKSTDFGEIVAAAGIGFTCEAGDSAQLLALCLRMFTDDSHRQSMGRKSRQYYEQCFDARKIASDLILKVQDAAIRSE
jgi:glycosyltransferase involved in cell wall biosynthesis